MKEALYRDFLSGMRKVFFKSCLKSAAIQTLTIVGDLK